MRKVSSFLIILSLFVSSFIQDAAALALKPNLQNTMEKQTKLDIQSARDKRLAAIKAHRDALALRRTLLSRQTLSSVNKVSASSLTSSLSPVIIYTGAHSTVSNQIPNIDITRVRGAWFALYNNYRSSLGLTPYSYDPRLDLTAHDWNLVFSAGKGQNHHRRNPGDAYYDFPVIDRWFIARGINPKIVNRTKHIENDGYGYYSCNDTDCTDELIASIRTTWNFFMSEKGKGYDAHYRTIIQPYITKMGFDIMVKPEENRYYMVIHFITE